MAAKVKFRGGWTCSCVAISLPWVEEDFRQRGIVQDTIDIFQLGWRDNVVASAGTHAEGGCTDVGQFSVKAIDVWRQWGWTMQRRDLAGIKTHAHGWPYGCNHLAPAADSQANDWDNKDAGLVGGANVVGRWPVKKWNVALEEMVRKMYTLDDIADAVEGRRGTLARAVANELASNGEFKTKLAMSVRNLVLGVNDDDLGDVIPTWHADGEGGNWRLQELARDTRLKVEGLDAKLDAILAALPKPPPA